MGVFEIDKQEPDVFWDALPRPLKIKKTKIVSHPILFTVWNGVRLDNRKSRDEGGARFYAPLLELLDVDTSEELRLDELAAISGESFLVMKWPLRLRLYPRLASKLVDITVNDRDVDDWARLECNAVNHVTLDWCFFWEGTNAFPLHSLTICLTFLIRDFPILPFRELKELRLTEVRLCLSETYFQRVKDMVTRQNLKIILELEFTNFGVEGRTKEEQWRREVAFWRPVKPPVTIIDRSRRFV